MDYFWQVVGLKLSNTNPSIPQAIFEVRWQCTGVKFGESHTTLGSTIFTVDPEKPFVALEMLKEKQVLDWIKEYFVSNVEEYNKILENIRAEVERKLLVPKELSYDQLPWVVKGTK